MMEYVRAFVVGGLLCVIAQILIDKTAMTPARILVLYVSLGAVLGGLGVYQPLVEYAGAGATVPLTGFGNSLAQGAIESAREDGLIGALSGGLKATSAGISAAIAFGYLNALAFKSKVKKY